MEILTAKFQRTYKNSKEKRIKMERKVKPNKKLFVLKKIEKHT